MKATWIFTRRTDGTIDVGWTEADCRIHRVRPLVEGEFTTQKEMTLVAWGMLYGYLKDEDGGEAKALALSAPLGQKLWKLGNLRKRLCNDGGTVFWVTDSEFVDLIAEVLVEAKSCAGGDAVVEYVGGQRRDTLRDETACRLLN
jgi:hypothetical protein